MQFKYVQAGFSIFRIDSQSCTVARKFNLHVILMVSSQQGQGSENCASMRFIAATAACSADVQ